MKKSRKHNPQRCDGCVGRRPGQRQVKIAASTIHQLTSWSTSQSGAGCAARPQSGSIRPDSQTVMAQLPKWFDDYNSYHPHSALGYVPAKLFREKRAVN